MWSNDRYIYLLDLDPDNPGDPTTSR